MLAVNVVNLKKFFGDFPALKGISFSVEEESIFGLIGPNGAGKTTTFRIIAGLLLPSSGVVEVFRKNIVEKLDEIRRIISYLPEDAGSYRNITGYEFLKMVAKIYFGNTSDAEESLELGIKLADLGDRIHDKMKTYSKGMKRRIQVARALMIKPKLAILDEPTAGLDVVYSKNIRDTIKMFSKEYGVTVLMSSHNMFEVEGVCEKIAIIDKGEILTEGYVDEILEKYGAKNLEEVFIKLTGE
ncbi:MAG TPA: ABC transporter ATP-binding protein [Thermoprotei archaeon]|nr:ABC transporter ATP-binding protein [Thermoprotei archaeon]